MTVHHTGESRCAGCGSLIDAATAMSDNGNAPREGDASVCFYCGMVGTYTDDGLVRRPTADEMREFLADPVIVQMVRRIAYRSFGR